MTQERKENRPTDTKLLTLPEILVQYPLQEATFTHEVRGGVDILTSQVSRNESGQIIYVVPGSSKYTERASKPESTPSSE